MSQEIDSNSRSILNFRPVIDFVEPEVEAATPNPITVPPIIDEEEVAEQVRLELFNLAESVDVLATALQARIDLKAKDMLIKLDPIVDDTTIAAINRAYPDHEADDGITYEMYQQCRENIRAYADAQANKNDLTEEEVAGAAADPEGIAGIFNSPDAKNGKMRPELSKKAKVIEEIDMKKFQISLLKILANFLWQMFVIKAFDIRIAGVGVKGLLPENLPGAKLNKTEKKVLKKLKKLHIPIPH